MAPPFPQGRPSTVAPGDVGQQQQDQIPVREKRHCWECMRRRLVCDSAPGACNKCKNRGVVCPGYDDKKPLRWLTPGKVLSKPRRPKNAAAAGDAASVTSLVPRATSQKKKTTKSKPRDESQTAKSATPAIHLEQSAVERYQLHRSDVSDIVQAVAFSWDSTREITSINWITPLPLDVLHGVEPAIAHSLTFCTLSYRMTQLSGPGGYTEDERLAISTKMYYHRDIAVRALSQALNDPKRQSDIVTLTAVFLFMVVDISQAKINWRHHYDGLSTIIRIRGGITTNLLPDPYHTIVLSYYFVTGVIGNTTSPAHDLAEPSMFIDNMDMMAKHYGDGRLPTLMCPPEIFLSIARINALRAEAAHPLPSTVQTLKARAQDLLQALDTRFRADAWAASFPSGSDTDNFLLLGRIYQSAAVVFCVSSLQSVRVLPRSPAVQACKARHHGQLLRDLQEGLCRRSARFRDVLTKCIMWPLLICGTGLYGGRREERSFIERELESMSLVIGSYLPVYGLSLIKRFWQSYELEWDECFDTPRAFVT
ncbi:hypothetical protein LQW54_008410 [Pestalotiopsis sp. IQ-011]